MTRRSIGRPRFVTIDEALAYQELAIARFGGAPGLRDRGLLESAIAMAQQGFGGEFAHAFPFEMAAAYAFHVAKNHPFVDGNKRAALACCVAFLRMNGWNLASEREDAADRVLDLTEGRLDKAGFALWLSGHCRERPTLELRDFLQSLDPQAYYRHLESMLAGSHAERMATLEDAARTLPIVEFFLRHHAVAVEKGHDAAASNSLLNAITMAALFRLAEDMGYEW